MPSDHPVAADVAKLEGWVSIRHVGLQICLLTWSFRQAQAPAFHVVLRRWAVLAQISRQACPHEATNVKTCTNQEYAE